MLEVMEDATEWCALGTLEVTWVPSSMTMKRVTSSWVMVGTWKGIPTANSLGSFKVARERSEATTEVPGYGTETPIGDVGERGWQRAAHIQINEWMFNGGRVSMAICRVVRLVVLSARRYLC